jgi:ribosomal protein L33
MKKGLTVLTASLAALLLVGCGNDKKVTNDDSNSNSNTESNITSNVESNSNITSNIESNSNSNITSNITSNINNGGSDLLSCTMDYSSQLGGSTNVYKSAIVNTNVKFVNGTANKIEMQMVFELTSTYASQIDMFVSTMKSTMQQQYTSTKGIKMTTDKLSATKFDIKITMDVTQMTEEELKSNNFDSFKTATFEQVKQALVQSGYTCK